MMGPLGLGTWDSGLGTWDLGPAPQVYVGFYLSMWHMFH